MIVHNVEKVTKKDLTIIYKPYAHPHTIKETCANFQNNQYKTARGVDGWTNGRMDGQTNG